MRAYREQQHQQFLQQQRLAQIQAQHPPPAATSVDYKSQLKAAKKAKEVFTAFWFETFYTWNSPSPFFNYRKKTIAAECSSMSLALEAMSMRPKAPPIR